MRLGQAWFLILTIAACGPAEPGLDAGAVDDAGQSPPADAGRLDAGSDAGADAGTPPGDAGADAGTPLGDAGADAGGSPDAGPGPDAGADAGGGADAGLDAGSADAGCWTIELVAAAGTGINRAALALRPDGGVLIAWIQAGGAVRLAEGGLGRTWRIRDLASGNVYQGPPALVVEPGGDTHVFYAEAASLSAPRRLKEYIDREDAGAGLLTVESSVSVEGYPSAVLDSAGGLAVTYADFTNQALRFATRAPAGAWQTATVDPPSGSTTQAGTWTSLAVAPSGALGVTYGEVVGHTLKYAERGADGGAWALSTLLNTGFSSDHSGLAFDPSGGAHVAAVRSGTLVVLRRAPGQSWTQEQVTAAERAKVGLAVLRDAGVHVVFFQSGNLVHAFRDATGWQVPQVAAQQTGAGVSAAVDSTGALHVAWTDDATHTIRYAQSRCW